MIIIYLLVYAFIIFFFFIERRLRKDNDAKTLEKSKYDKRTTNVIGLSFLVAILLLIITPLFNYYKIGIVNSGLRFNFVGLVIILTGLIIRITAAITLGRFYTRTLKITENHVVVSNGIYKYIRHPGYLGTILFFIGAGIFMGNTISIIIISACILPAYIYRIKIEEEMLIEAFGDRYKIYAKKTKKLIPFIW